MPSEVSSEKQKTEFCHFVYQVYRGNPNYKDNFNYNVKYFLWPKGVFARHCKLFPFAVYEQKTMVARCLFIYHPRLQALQMGFFEALPGQQAAVDRLLNKAESLATKLGLKRLLIGLNGHLAYGVGLLANAYDLPNTFDGPYSQPYYLDYFRHHRLTEHTLTTYQYQTANADFTDNQLQRIYQHFSFRNINLKKLPEEMSILGKLFNETLSYTRFYFDLSAEESYELMKPLVPLLSDDNIIFALYQGKEIGFIFWHPDYHQLLKPGKNHVSAFLLKYFFKRKMITDFKINSLGVLPEFWRSGVATGLINEIYQRTKGHYRGGETSFIWDDNYRSTLTATHLTGKTFKRYVLFEKTMADNTPH